MRRILLLLALAVVISGCDHGYSPPEPSFGALSGTVHFIGDWPAASEVRLVRFAALPFKPATTDEILLRLTDIILSPGLETFGTEATFFLPSVPTGRYIYSIVALQFGPSALDVRVIGEYTDNDGVFVIDKDQSTSIEITVDFAQPPIFPPQ